MADKVNKVVYGDETLIDLTEDTVTEDTLAKGTTAHNAAGLAIEGTFEDAIQHIKVNGTEQPIEDNTVDLDIPTKVSELDNDVPYVEQEAQSAIDAGFDARITALEASADWVYVEDDSLIFTANASYADEVLTITGDASVDDEVLMFGGESPGGESNVISGYLDKSESIVVTGGLVQISIVDSDGDVTIACLAQNKWVHTIVDNAGMSVTALGDDQYEIRAGDNYPGYYIAITAN